MNLANVTNSATIGVGSSVTSVGVTLSALETVNGADSTSTFDTETTSGAAAGTIGVAGSVSVAIITIDTTASIGDGATVNAGGGDVSLSAASAAASTNKAQPKVDGVTAKTVGVGASVALTILNDTTTASVGANATLDGREQPDALGDDDRFRDRLREERRGRRRRAHGGRRDHALERHHLGDDRRRLDRADRDRRDLGDGDADGVGLERRRGLGEGRQRRCRRGARPDDLEPPGERDDAAQPDRRRRDHVRGARDLELRGGLGGERGRCEGQEHEQRR